MSDEKELLDSNQMLAAEFAAIHGAPPFRPGSLSHIQRLHYDKQSSALCLSGGGIRSAAFCLGAVQGLARRAMLKRFQYLSTVSGGGYTGSLLSAWAYRAADGIKEVEDSLNRRQAPETEEERRRDPIRWLRNYTSYLNPRYGFRSPDTWTLIAIYVRNLILNWLVLLPGIAALMCIPFAIGGVMFDSMWHGHRFNTVAHWTGLSLTAVALLLLRLRLTFFPGHNEFYGVPLHRLIVLVLTLAAVFVTAQTLGLSQLDRGDGYPVGSKIYRTEEPVIALVTHLFYTEMAVSVLIIAFCIWRTRKLALIVPLAFGLSLISTLAALASQLWFLVFRYVPIVDGTTFGWHLIAVFMPPAWLLLIVLPEALFVGIVSRFSDDSDREWWARAVAFLFAVAIGWVIVGSLVFLGPTILAWAWDAIGPYVTPTAMLSALLAAGGLVARRGFIKSFARQDSDVPQGMSWSDRLGYSVLTVVAAIFIAVFLASIAMILPPTLDWSQEKLSPILGSVLDRPGLLTLYFVVPFVLFSLLALVFGYFVNVNTFSLHGMYRDRLSRAFLAASRWKRDVPSNLSVAPGSPEERQFQDRREDRFTEFDRYDSPLLQWLDPLRRPGIAVTGSSYQPEEKDPTSPLPIATFVGAPLQVISCALNMVGDNKNKALQERKATSFTFTPLYTGSHGTGYRRTDSYGGPDGLSLATAMTISGAAVSPNAGHHSTPIITFVMTLFNARLGWWLGNPSDATTSSRGAPGISVMFLLRELFGLTRDVGKWVFLSDGGHFDNLGIYEMVRRGCRHIVAIDSSADPDRNFEDLGNAIRKARIDFGVEISRREEFQIGGRDRGMAGRYAAVFDIVYPHLGPDEAAGTLIYIKPVIYRDTGRGAPLDVVEYGSRSGAFPHEPTSDQFYLESQFESYRALGEHEIEEIVHGFAWTVPELAISARAHIREPFVRGT